MAMETENLTENVIHVTGFGPFRGFTTTNPSWEAVSRLPNHTDFNQQRFPIVKHEIPVTYQAVDRKVREIWSSKPKLVIHCGVSVKSDKICLEKNAFNGNFCDADFTGQTLESKYVELMNAGAECEKLCTTLDLNTIVNETDAEKITCSKNPGNYLCGYIYLRSLDMDRSRCLFVHVPPVDEQFTIEVISDGILSVIRQCLRQLEEKTKL